MFFNCVQTDTLGGPFSRGQKSREMSLSIRVGAVAILALLQDSTN